VLASGCVTAFGAVALRRPVRSRAAFAWRVAILRALGDVRAGTLRLFWAFRVFAVADFGAPPIRKSSILCPAFSAAESQTLILDSFRLLLESDFHKLIENR